MSEQINDVMLATTIVISYNIINYIQHTKHSNWIYFLWNNDLFHFVYYTQTTLFNYLSIMLSRPGNLEVRDVNLFSINIIK